MDLDHLLQGWVPFVAPKRVSVVETALDAVLARALRIGCTDPRCKYTRIPPSTSTVVCDRCELVREINALDRREVT